MKLSELITKHGDIELEDIPEETIDGKPIKAKTVWDLKWRDDVYVVNGGVDKFPWNGDDDYLLNLRLCGLVFISKEEAQFKYEQMKVEAELERLGGTRDMMSLGDNGTPKWRLEYDFGLDELNIVGLAYITNRGSYHFTTREICRKVIDAIGKDRLKKYIFYVKD